MSDFNHAGTHINNKGGEYESPTNLSKGCTKTHKTIYAEISKDFLTGENRVCHTALGTLMSSTKFYVSLDKNTQPIWLIIIKIVLSSKQANTGHK